METVRIQYGDTERIEALMLDNAGDPLTGLSDVLLAIRRISDSYWLDFNDNTFKNSGWTTRQQVMTEVDVTNDAGKYKYDFNTTGFSDNTYELRVDCASADNVPQIGELKVGGYVDNLDAAVSSRSSHDDPDPNGYINAAISSRSSHDDPDPGGYIDASISSRSSHSATDVWSVATRTLTSFGTLVSDVWNAGTRTLTGFGTLIADIWNNVTRTLTTGTKDTEIDAIKAKTDNLPADPASETNVNANETKIDTIQATLDNVTYGLNALKTLIDAVQTDLDNPDQYKADVSNLALEATLNAIKGAGWTTETLKAIKAAIAALNDISAPDVDTQLSSSHGAGSWQGADVSGLALENTAQAIKVKTDNLPADPASESSLIAINGIVTDTRRIVKNKLTIDMANSKLQLWNDAGDALLYEWDLTDSDGSTVVLQSGPPANRGVPVTP